MICLSAEIFIMFKDEIILKKDPINRVTTEVSKEPFQPFQHLGVKEAETPGNLDLLRFKIITLASILRRFFKTVVRIARGDPCKEIQSIPMHNLCHLTQNIINDQGVPGLEINSLFMAGRNKFKGSPPFVLKDFEDQGIDSCLFQDLHLSLHFLQGCEIEIKHLGADAPLHLSVREGSLDPFDSVRALSFNREKNATFRACLGRTPSLSLGG